MKFQQYKIYTQTATGRKMYMTCWLDAGLKVGNIVSLKKQPEVRWVIQEKYSIVQERKDLEKDWNVERTIMKVYRIYDPATGLYSKGGICPYFTVKGKVWKGLGHIKNHLNQLRKYMNTGAHPRLNEISRWQIIEYTVSETPTDTISVSDIFAQVDAKRVAEKQAYEEKSRKERERAERKLLSQLKEKYESS